MQDIGILHNDLLAVHKTHEINNGQVVVARIEDGVTVKQFRRRGSIITLLPKNPEFSKSLRKEKKSEKPTKGSPKGAPDANEELLWPAGVPRAATRATRK